MKRPIWLLLGLAISLQAQLPKHVLAYVDQHFPGATFPSEEQYSNYFKYSPDADPDAPPWFVICDLTGDGSTDFALLLIDSLKTRYIAIHSVGKGLKHYQLFPPTTYRPDLPIRSGIVKMPPGLIQETRAVDNPRMVDHPLPGVHIIFFETSSVYVYWLDNHYEHLWTSD